jgi:CTP:molybdopterin cytidylyltransferase MocA
MTLGGVILAAGGARRFGAVKQLAELDGRPLMCHAMEALIAVPRIERRVVVLGSHAEEIRAHVDVVLDRWEVVECPDWEEGLSASLRAAIRALRECDAVLVLLADQPGVTPEVIAQIAGEADRGVKAARAVYDGEPGHPVLICRDLYDDVLALTGDTGARELLADVHADQIEVGGLARPHDVDTPEQLEAYSQP